MKPLSRTLTTGVLAMLALAAAASAWAGDPAGRRLEERVGRSGWGPFIYSSQSFFKVMRFGYLHQHPALGPAGSLDAQVSATWSNHWYESPGRMRFDGETMHVRPLAHYAVADRLEVGLEVPMLYLSGGLMDGTIERFHNTFGLGNMDRDVYPRDQLRAEVHLPSGSTRTIADSDDAGSYLLAPVLSLRFGLTPPRSSVPVTLTGRVNFPQLQQKNPVVENRGHDAAIGIAMATRFASRWGTTLSAALIRARSGEPTPHFPAERRYASLMASADYTLNTRNALVAEVLYESPVVESSGTGFDKPTYDALLGWKRLTAGGSLLEVGFVENLFVHDNNIDFAIHAGLHRPLF